MTPGTLPAHSPSASAGIAEPTATPLSQLLEWNYDSHPAFRFDAPALDVEQSLLDAFDTAYGALCRFGHALDPSSRQRLERQAKRALEGVFSGMASQCTEPLERAFVEDLAVECARLLAEESKWYAQPPARSRLSLTTGEADAAAMQLATLRHVLGRLPEPVVAELREIASEDVSRFEAAAAAGRLRRTDLSVDHGRTVRRLIACLNRAFDALGMLDAVSTYIGRPTRVVGLSLELSVAQSSWWKNAIDGLPRAPETLYAHLDESISFPKAIVYLTDVAAANGPTGCYPRVYDRLGCRPLQEIVGRVVGNVGNDPRSPLRAYYAKAYHQSMASENFRRHFMRLPRDLRFNSHFGWDVMPGGALENGIAAQERRMVGPAGTFIVFDGARLLHRGGLISEGRRVALQVVFSDITFTRRAWGRLKRAAGWA